MNASLSCYNPHGDSGHPTYFLHWDIFKEDKLTRAALLKEGNCACALRRRTRGKKKHITQTFFGIKEYRDLWFHFRFIPSATFSLCVNAKTFSHIGL